MKTGFRKRALAGLITGVGALALVVGIAVPAQAASADTWGTLNCTGSTVHFTTVRSASGGNQIQYQLLNETGSTYGTDGTYLGITVSGTDQGLHFMFLPQAPNSVLSSTWWLQGTQFKMYGKMLVSNGTCDNFFSGTLYY
jgi:hypothetical protein